MRRRGAHGSASSPIHGLDGGKGRAMTTERAHALRELHGTPKANPPRARPMAVQGAVVLKS